MSGFETTPVSTWQFYRACKRVLGIKVLNKIYSGVKGKKCKVCSTRLVETRERQINRWCAHPDYTESNQKNPADRIEILLDRLMDHGKENIAIGLVDRFARVVGCTLRFSNPISDKDTIEEELLDNLPALAEYQESARPDANQPLCVIRKKAQALIREIEEDVSLIEKTRGE